MTRIDITLGLITSIATIAVIAFVGLGEDHRMEQAARSFDVRSVERGAQLFDQYCADCHGPQAVGGMCPPLDQTSGLHGGTVGPGVAWRLEELGWDPKDPYGYVYSVIEGGRQISTRPWRWAGNRVGTDKSAMAMPAWSQDYNQPLRPDQIKDLANFIVAHNDNIPDTLEEALEYVDSMEGKVSVFSAPSANPRPDGSDPAELGEWLFADLGCTTCHVYEGVSNPQPATGPPLTDVAANAEERIAADDYTGEATTAEAYILESIVSPAIHIVAGFEDVVMPASFGGLAEEDLEALVAFLMGEPSAAAGGADDAGDDEGDGDVSGDIDAGEDAVTEDDDEDDTGEGEGEGGDDGEGDDG